MALTEKLQFAVLFLILAVWTMLSCVAVVRPDSLAWLWRGSSSRLFRLFGVASLIAGLVFCYFVIADLATGTFKWKGGTKAYGFSDFAR